MSLSDRDLEFAIKAIDDYFVSGNDVPVGRATIKREEWEAVKAFLAERDARQVNKMREMEMFIELAFEAHPNLDLDIEAIKAMKGE